MFSTLPNGKPQTEIGELSDILAAVTRDEAFPGTDTPLREYDTIFRYGITTLVGTRVRFLGAYTANSGVALKQTDFLRTGSVATPRRQGEAKTTVLQIRREEGEERCLLGSFSLVPVAYDYDNGQFIGLITATEKPVMWRGHHHFSPVPHFLREQAIQRTYERILETGMDRPECIMTYGKWVSRMSEKHALAR